ncbi:MAG TPA: hypothetical protein VHW44_24325 [Pseudonocardiaceae bacterium]|jgi:NADPH:quinone reductase-like Zn-dependent oxidoreductase|nr:hypothetical protein [Pseudonocardiaceae bacterium]
MSAVQFTEYGPARVVHVADVDAPHAGPNKIRIAVRASGISPGEIRIRTGEMLGRPRRRTS